MARANSSPTLEVFQNISCYCLTQFHVGRRDSDTISKHLMLLFNLFVRVWSFVFSVISKHLMLLFNKTTCRFFVTCFLISKHLMLLFNYAECPAKDSGEPISKHLMLLFNQIHPCRMPRKKFQNISCYCLTL